jgi:hypothetical protein
MHKKGSKKVIITEDFKPLNKATIRPVLISPASWNFACRFPANVNVPASKDAISPDDGVRI